MLPLQTRPCPNMTPAPLRHEFLSRACKVAGSVCQGSVHIFFSNDGLADLEAFVKEGLVEVVEVRIVYHIVGGGSSVIVNGNR